MAQHTRPRKPRKRPIIAGVDTHADTHHAAVIGAHGAAIADAEFPTTEHGYAQLLDWLGSFGRLRSVGVEGTGSYGAGLSRHLCAQGVPVVEVNHPDRTQRRLTGKSDPLDAYAAAQAILAQRATAIPKLGTGIAEAIRVLHTVRASAVKARTATINELRALLVTAPTGLRDAVRGLGPAALIGACTRLRPGPKLADPEQATKQALRMLARRYQTLTDEITTVEDQLHPLVRQACPGLLDIHGVGYETAAQLLITIGDNPDRIHTEAAFAALCGVAPIPASSGKTTRHRLSRGGDRQANRALYLIVCSRLASDPATRAYRDRRRTQGLSNPEIIRCLKRYLTREIYKALTSTNTQPEDLVSAA
jgi:transposase